MKTQPSTFNVQCSMLDVRTRHCSTAFTLIELLVLLAIISVLIAILLPSLSAARENAKTVQCLSNLRQMATATLAYTHTSGGYYPLGYWNSSNSSTYTSMNWDYTTIKNLSTGQTIVQPGLLWMGGEIASVQQCPGYDGKSNTASDPYTGYNYNTSYIGHGQNETVPAPLHISRMRRSAQCALFGDGEYIGGANKFMRSPFPTPGDASFSSRAAGAQGFRHRGRTNVAYADGHAQSQSARHTNTTPSQTSMLNPRVGFLSADNSAYDPG